MSNTIIITWVRNGMALGTKWYGTRAHRYEMTRNPPCHGGVCSIVFDIDGMLFEFCKNFLNIEKINIKN